MRFTVMAAAMLLALAASAQAQTTLIPLPHVPIRILPTDGTAYAHTGGARGTVTTAADRPIAAVAALSMFKVSFENGDHKFRRMQVLRENDTLARFALNDSGDDDPFMGEARWVNIVGGQAGMVEGRGGGRVIAELPLGPRPANTTWVLTGFEIRRTDNTDANVQTFGIELSPDGTAVRVSLVDLERADLRLQVLRTPARSGPDIGRRYTCKIQYAWVPNSAISGRGTITGNQNGRDAARVPAGLAAITGFNFTFENGDHYVLQTAINLADGGEAHFQDNNLDDPMRYRVNYVTLRGS